jgi:hypothetical protein
VAKSTIQVSLFEGEDRPAVLVASHERSGTHFLLNALQAAYAYSAQPWFSFDTPPLTINFYSPPAVKRLLNKYAAQPVKTLVKSHHHFEFFSAAFSPVPKRWIVFCVYRHPVDVMISFQRFINHWSWHEGPRSPTALEFARAAPEGRMMRYQITQHDTLLHRWASHVESWHEAARSDSRVILVSYEQLSNDYEHTVRSFSHALRAEPVNLTPPSADENVVAPRRGMAIPFDNRSRDALHEQAVRTVGDTMKKLGYV